MKPRNVGELMLMRLKSLGVDQFFANPGSEFVSLMRGFHELPKGDMPAPISVPHEFLAVSLAYGNYLTTGKAQVVMTHTNVGAANALIGLIGASRMNVPMIFIAGLTARSEREGFGHRDRLIHWAQDARDPGGMFREYVKWEAEISDPRTALDVLERAYAIAHSPPFGPVAIKVSRDVLMSTELSTPKGTVASFTASAPSRSAVRTFQAWLKDSERPLVVTNRLGANVTAVAKLIELSNKHAFAVATPEDFYMSFPADHPHHLGFAHGAALAEADLILCLDTDVPWFPLEDGPAVNAKVIQVGPDPLFNAIPLRSHRSDLTISAGVREFLEAILECEPAHENLAHRKAWISRAHSVRARTPISKKFDAISISHVLADFLDESTILVNELSLSGEALRPRFAGQYFRSGSASPLGWGVGCALGLSMANPKKNIIAGIGDGVFFLSPVLGTLAMSVRHAAPFITVVLNNGGMASITKAAQSFYPNLPAQLPLSSFPSSEMNLEKCADTVGGLGLRACSQDEFRKSLNRAIEFCRECQRPAVINAIMD